MSPCLRNTLTPEHVDMTTVRAPAQDAGCRAWGKAY